MAALLGGVLLGFFHGVERLEVNLFAGNPERFAIAVFEEGVNLAVVAIEDYVILRHFTKVRFRQQNRCVRQVQVVTALVVETGESFLPQSFRRRIGTCRELR